MQAMKGNKQWENNNNNNNHKNNKRRMDTDTVTHTTHIHIHIHTLLLLLLLLYRVSKSWKTQRSAEIENVSSTSINYANLLLREDRSDFSRPKTTGTTVAWLVVRTSTSTRWNRTRITNRWLVPSYSSLWIRRKSPTRDVTRRNASQPTNQPEQRRKQFCLQTPTPRPPTNQICQETGGCLCGHVTTTYRTEGV